MSPPDLKRDTTIEETIIDNVSKSSRTSTIWDHDELPRGNDCCDLRESNLGHLLRQEAGKTDIPPLPNGHQEDGFWTENKDQEQQTTPTQTSSSTKILTRRTMTSHVENSMRHQHHHHHHYCRKGTHAFYYAHNSPDSYQLCDLEEIAEQFHQWKHHFNSHPIVGGNMTIRPYYTMHKCNRDIPFVQTLANIGANFKCFKLSEIEFVRQYTTAAGCYNRISTPPPDIIFASPRKVSVHIKEAYETYHVRKMTFDSIPEIIRCSKVSYNIQLLLQISQTDLLHNQDSHDEVDRVEKLHKWKHLLSVAHKKGMKVVGVCVNLDSTAASAATSIKDGDNNTMKSDFNRMLEQAQSIFTMAYQDFGYQMTILDIGGAGSPIGKESLCTHVSNIITAIAETAQEDDEEERSGDNRAEEPQEDSSGRPTLETHDIVETKFYTVIHSLQEYFPPPPLVEINQTARSAKNIQLEIIAEPAHYLVADRSAVVKWWGMAKTKRPASCLYTYLIKTLIAEVEDNRQLLKSPIDKIRANYYASHASPLLKNSDNNAPFLNHNENIRVDKRGTKEIHSRPPQA